MNVYVFHCYDGKSNYRLITDGERSMQSRRWEQLPTLIARWKLTYGAIDVCEIHYKRMTRRQAFEVLSDLHFHGTIDVLDGKQLAAGEPSERGAE